MKNKILIGITLFSMFFGAGNLIFPPFLGAEAGTSGWLAFVGLSFSAVCFPILGVVAVTLSGGADRMADRVHPMFSVVVSPFQGPPALPFPWQYSHFCQRGCLLVLCSSSTLLYFLQ